jgi:hypothetical protein
MSTTSLHPGTWRFDELPARDDLLEGEIDVDIASLE